MKKFISLILSLIFVLSTATVFISAEDGSNGSAANPKGTVMMFNDLDGGLGCSGYAVNTESYTQFQGIAAEVPKGRRFSEKGITVAFDFMISEACIRRNGDFAALQFFVNNPAPHNYASFNFTVDNEPYYEDRNLAMIYTGPWPTYNPVDESSFLEWDSVPYDWEFGVWYRFAVVFDKNFIAMYVNGEYLTEWDFDNNDHAFVLMYPEAMICYFDNFVTATADYDLENENYRNNPEVYDYIDFESARDDGGGVSAGDWGFASSSYSLIKLNKVTVPFSTHIVGDVDDSGLTNILDATFIARSIAGFEDDEMIAPDYGDVNDDGSTNILDAISIVKFIAGHENFYGIGEEKKVYGSFWHTNEE